jgi:hypothetical protein
VVADDRADVTVRHSLRTWLLEDYAGRPKQLPGPYAVPEAPKRRHPRWRVMCLSGLDYFSTLGYQPGIAALAAGLLSPIATMVLVLVTPRRGVTGLSPRGGGEPARRRVDRHA